MKSMLIKSFLILISFVFFFVVGRFSAPKISNDVNLIEKTDEQKQTQHIERTIKKKDDLGRDVEIKEVVTIEDFISHRQTEKNKTVPRDNIKFPINSNMQIGIEISPFNHHWIGYMRDFKTNENIYQYSYSTRIF